jgi:hypothetical protein
MTLFERSPDKYAAQYLYDEKQRVSRNMAYGSMMAEGLENDEATGDAHLDLMMSRIPKFERMDRPVEDPRGPAVTFRGGESANVPVLLDGKTAIALLALPDTAKPDYSAFKEYKTSVRAWTQKMADDSGQITFYTTAIWLATGKIPGDIELVNVPVQYEPDGRITPTGELVRLPTKRTMVDVIKMTKRIKKAWSGIQELCEKELI